MLAVLLPDCRYCRCRRVSVLAIRPVLAAAGGVWFWRVSCFCFLSATYRFFAPAVCGLRARLNRQLPVGRIPALSETKVLERAACPTRNVTKWGQLGAAIESAI